MASIFHKEPERKAEELKYLNWDLIFRVFSDCKKMPNEIPIEKIQITTNM